MVKINSCVFISGYGSNLKNLIIRSRENVFPIKVSLVICNKISAKGILHAKKNKVPYFIVNTEDNRYEHKILIELKKYNISLICLAGYMKILSKRFIKNFGKKIVNIHPSLLPKYKGLNTFKRVLQNNEKKTGCTVHFVNEKLDSGKIITQKSFFINEKDKIDDIKLKTQKLEHKAFSEAIINIYRNT